MFSQGELKLSLHSSRLTAEGSRLYTDDVNKSHLFLFVKIYFCFFFLVMWNQQQHQEVMSRTSIHCLSRKKQYKATRERPPDHRCSMRRASEANEILHDSNLESSSNIQYR